MERRRRRAGSLSAAKSTASSDASASLSSPAVIGGQHVSALALAVRGMDPHPVVLTFVNLSDTLDVSTTMNVLEEPVARVQLALNVSNLSEAIIFYMKLFGSAPAKVQTG